MGLHERDGDERRQGPHRPEPAPPRRPAASWWATASYTDDVNDAQARGVRLSSCAARTRMPRIDVDRRRRRRRRQCLACVAVFTGADHRRGKGLGGLIVRLADPQSKDGTPMKEPAPTRCWRKARCGTWATRSPLIVAEIGRPRAKTLPRLVVVDYEESCRRPIDITKAHESDRLRGARRGGRITSCYDWEPWATRPPSDAAFAERGARDQARPRQQPDDPERDGAARRQRQLRQVGSELHALRRQPEPARRALADVRFRARPAENRRLRVIAPDVGGGFGSKIPLYAEETALVWAVRSSCRPADQVDGRAQRIVPHRRARPRPCERRPRWRWTRTATSSRFRVKTKSPTWAPTSVDLRVVHSDHPLRDLAVGPVQDACHLLRSEGGVHQHGADRRLPRRRPAGSDLRRRAHGRAVRA